MTAATHETQLITVVDETPAPSPVPRPTSQPRQVSPARSLIPTPEVSSSTVTNGHRLSSADVERARNLSTAGSYISHEERSAGAGMSSDAFRRNRNNRMELEKENRNPLVPDPRERVLSAPPSLGHPRSNVKYRQVPRPQDEAPADHSYRRRAVPGHERHMDGGASAHYRVSRPPSSRYSLHSRGHDVSALRERQDQDFNTEQDVFVEEEAIVHIIHHLITTSILNDPALQPIVLKQTVFLAQQKNYSSIFFP
ncbi:hypothetical protein OS493_003351 [Desmophyllum pertusum]|uniref:Uncharacterized protein n=1 Tax=Desmophyllum pertusum TaxID=174260 RepID=A0A9X0A596_9CNID|nr:hypothetical protein OS493_003351 [Desmophyllum pertusum]